MGSLLCSCQTSYRPRFDISPKSVRDSALKVGDGPYTVVEIRKFSFPEFACNTISRKNYPCMEVIPGSEIMPELMDLFPSVFADTPEAVPIIVMQNVRSGALSAPDGCFFFDGAAGFGGQLSLKHRSEMASPVPPPPCFYFNSLACVGTLGLLPFYGGSFSSHYGVSIMTGYDNYSDEVLYSAKASRWISSMLYRPFMPKSSGWIHNGALSPEVNPDATAHQKRTALCCAIAKALAEMPPSARAELRRNPVALLRDKECEGQRSFSLVQVRPPSQTTERRMGEDPDRPRIVAQSYDPLSDRGYVSFDVAGCEDPKKARAWIQNSYLPLVAAAKGAAIDVSAPKDAPQPAARIQITGFVKESETRFRIDFAVLE